ncbi:MULTISPECIES: HPr family phosphocarrier protein [unclassified Thermotoga]|jgi:phosphocarrier protein|uniref:HPr family phosphocarrier protein n=1 Tax=Fervidobacterium pennivorans TaxID=93466 RepID=A0A7V4KCJ9_FERPE|nr:MULTISPECIES: HPr family phosphocarrier protein [unclassified Thermotoga]ACB08991.1 Phosphotransferase system, phosphocarrier protein HPr [Thermotoga sp. RQ2]AIY86200.1 phosphotransferase system, phosphocarrier protein HPr [Thermotoga sp. 2812B]EJX26135.1 phosphotransferase system, phosphocarrier protein HPr [Thermotoga sp. EMP]KAF2959478.1 serine kinase [Thermotoga sp. 38H-to]
MVEAKITLKNPTGLHARPASIFVSEAGKLKSDIFIVKEGKEANAKSILQVLAMGIKQGDEIILRASGEDEEEAIKRLTELLENLAE